MDDANSRVMLLIGVLKRFCLFSGKMNMGLSSTSRQSLDLAQAMSSLRSRNKRLVLNLPPQTRVNSTSYYELRGECDSVAGVDCFVMRNGTSELSGNFSSSSKFG